MKLTQKLIGYLNRVFSKDPKRSLALRVRYNGTMAWSVSDGVIFFTATGGSGASFSEPLDGHTMASLAVYIAGRSGYEVVYLNPDLSGTSAAALIDSAGNQAESNGDHLYAYTSFLWSYLDSVAFVLKQAGDVAVAAPAMMSAATGEGLWLDEIGEYYNVKRRSGELDSNYGARITAEAVRPKSNGIAIEMAVKSLTGQDVTVSDSTKFSGVTPSYDSTIFHNGAYSYSNIDIPLYGLFDLQYNFDLESDYDVSAFVAQVLELVAAIRAAGTHLRPIIANGHTSDEFIEKPSDPAQALVTDDYIYDGSRTHDGSFYYAGVAGETEITDRPRPILRYYLPQNSKAGRMNSSLLVTLAV